MDAVRTFFADYWAWDTSRYILMGVGVVFLVTATFYRRPGLAFGIALAGFYVSLAVFMMSAYEHYDIDIMWALAAVVAGGLVVGIIFYWGFFVRN